MFVLWIICSSSCSSSRPGGAQPGNLIRDSKWAAHMPQHVTVLLTAHTLTPRGVHRQLRPLSPSGRWCVPRTPPVFFLPKIPLVRFGFFFR